MPDLAPVLIGCTVLAILVLAAIWATDRICEAGNTADEILADHDDDATWLDPHETWLPRGQLTDADVDERFDAMVRAEWTERSR